MQNHQRIHTGERPHKCDYCGKAFMQKGNLVAHLRIHTGEKPFRCHLCSMAFTQKTSLVGHVRTHTGEKPFQCRFCPMVFARKMQMKRHEVTHMWSAAEAAAHAVAREASLMNNSGSSGSAWSSSCRGPPINTVTSGKALQLEELRFNIAEWRIASASVAPVDGSTYITCLPDRRGSISCSPEAAEVTGSSVIPCMSVTHTLAPTATSPTGLRSSLNIHLRIHTDSATSHRRPGRPRSLLDVHTGGRVWQCLVCAYTTKYRTNMKNHERIHTGERPHKCHVCGKAFMQKGNLVTHLRIHTGERPFQCHLCHITFKQKINLATHMGTHTNSCSESTK
nr:zinc finger protein 471-like [Rhipicephalus microplus]